MISVASGLSSLSVPVPSTASSSTNSGSASPIPSKDHSGLSGGTIAGIVVGGLLGVIISAVLACWMIRRNNAKNKSSAPVVEQNKQTHPVSHDPSQDNRQSYLSASELGTELSMLPIKSQYGRYQPTSPARSPPLPTYAPSSNHGNMGSSATNSSYPSHELVRYCFEIDERAD